MKQNIKTALNLLNVVYCVTVLLYQIFYLIVPFRQMLAAIGGEWISPGLAILGSVLLGMDLLTERVFLRAVYVKWLLVTLAVLCLSSLVYIQYGWTDNAKVIVWQAVQMLIVYPMCYRLSKEKIYDILKGVYFVVSIVFAISVIISLYQFFTLTSYEVIGEGGSIRQGFQEGRLFGIFGSVYFSSLFIVLLLTIAIYQAVHTRGWGRIWYVIVSILFFLYIILSRTRSVLVAGTMAVFLFVVCFVWRKYHISSTALKKKKSYLFSFLAGMVSVVLLLSMYSGINFILKQFVVLSSQSNTVEEEIIHEEKDERIVSEEYASEPIVDLDVDLEREDVKASNISNGRFQIWEDYLEVTTNSLPSTILGLTPGNYMSIIRENYPDIFIVSYIRNTYPQMYEDNLIYDTHNGYISVFVASGVLGVFSLGVFLVFCSKKVLNYFVVRKMYSSRIVLLSAIIFIILVSVFFDSDLFFRCTSTSLVFWLLAGLLMKEICATES